MASWYPSVLTYRQFAQANTFFEDVTDSIETQTVKIRHSIEEHKAAISDQTKQIVASNSQIVSALESGFNHIAQINERGFDQVSSAVEAMHSDLNYNFGILIQRMEYQNGLLTNILKVLQAPFETQVIEYYNKGCLFVVQGFLEGAIQCFKTSISINDMGTYFFPSHYQLGRIYLSGTVDTVNLIDPGKATEYLLKSNEFGNRIVKSDQAFKPILADCKFYLSQSFYRQLTGNKDSGIEQELLNNAIKYCNEAVILNPKLSQGYYHLAQYYSYQNDAANMVTNLKKAIEIDRKYSLHVLNDKVFREPKNLEAVKDSVIELLSKEKNKLRLLAEPELKKAKDYITQFESKGITQFQNIVYEFNELKKQVYLADKDFQTQTYFGFDDCLIKIKNL